MLICNSIARRTERRLAGLPRYTYETSRIQYFPRFLHFLHIGVPMPARHSACRAFTRLAGLRAAKPGSPCRLITRNHRPRPGRALACRSGYPESFATSKASFILKERQPSTRQIISSLRHARARTGYDDGHVKVHRTKDFPSACPTCSSAREAEPALDPSGKAGRLHTSRPPIYESAF